MSSLTARALVALGRVTEVAAAPCGRWAAVTVERLDEAGAAYMSDLWRVGLSDATPASRLTVGDSRDRAPHFRADGALAFLSDRPTPGSGSPKCKRSQVWVLPAAGGEPRVWLDEPLGVRAFRCGPDGAVVLADVLPGVPHDAQRQAHTERAERGSSVLHYRAMPVRYWDHWLPPQAPHLIAYDADGRGRRDLTPDAGEALRETAWALSADGGQVAATWAVINPADRIADQPLALIDVATGAMQLLGTAPGTVHGPPRFSPDGGRVATSRYVRTPDRYGPKRLVTYPVGGAPSPSGTVLTGHWDRWPEATAWSADGGHVIVTADDEGTHGVFAVSVADGVVTRLVRADAGGTHGAVTRIPGQDRLVMTRSTRLSPPEVHVLPIAADGVPTPLARLSGFDPAWAQAATQEVVWADVDGRRVHSFIVRPTVPPDDPPPHFLWIHGGPVSAWNDGWHWRWCPLLLAAAGHTLVLPNPAGSTGFGGEWVQGIWGNTWGGRCYDDLMGLVDVLERDHGLAAADTVAMGGSFGGYMANWIGANTDRFKLLVTHASLYAMSSFYGVTDVPAWWSLMMGGAPFDDPVAFDRYSPSARVGRWRTPTLVLHGDKDYRVPVGESLALFEALQAHGVTSELVIFPDENHWILKPRNVVAWYEAVLDFIGRHGSSA